MADLKISDLTPTGSVESNDYFIINKGDTTTQKISFVSLEQGIFGDSGFRPIMVNFPAATNSSRDQGAFASSSSERSDLLDLFGKEGAKREIPMPEGANAAIAFLSYKCSINSTPLYDSSPTPGYANFGYVLEISSSSGGVTISPGGTNNTFAFGTKLRCDIRPWSEVVSAPAIRRTGLETGVSVAQRLNFTAGTSATPTVLTLKPNGTIHRLRACSAGLGSGKVMIFPYKTGTAYAAALEPLVESFANIEDDIDDGVATPAADQLMVSADIKAQMNYLTNAIRETLDYGGTFNAQDQKRLEDALVAVFAIRDLTSDDYADYYTALDGVRASIIDLVGFKLGFQTDPDAQFVSF